MARKARIAANTINEYLAAVSPEQRAALERLRRIINAAAPAAEECISYKLPAFRFEGRMLVWFGAGTNHCAFYPGGVVNEFRDELAGFNVSKGTVRFQPDRPLPVAIIRKLVRARLRRNARSRPRGRVSRAKSRMRGRR